uniref:Uncharacterized protein n=1 Tax=Globisporangium ultimum (strain ATCC 200006 / CBS 805.95 / DAOM BR144) TaxID=431595 RepID=K3WJE7_GLOUD
MLKCIIPKAPHIDDGFTLATHMREDFCVPRPNAEYYQDRKDLTEAKMHGVVISTFIYALLELLGMVYAHLTIRRHVGMSVFYQLAFGLESKWRICQCYLFILPTYPQR